MEQGGFRVTKTPLGFAALLVKEPCFHSKQGFPWVNDFSVKIVSVAHRSGLIISYPYLYSRRATPKMCFCTWYPPRNYQHLRLIPSYSFINSICKTTIFNWFHYYAKNNSLRNQKRVVKSVSFCLILPVRLTKFNWLSKPSHGLRIRDLTTSLFLPKLHSA